MTNLLLLVGIVMFVLISNVETIATSTMHLGKEVQLCEKYINHGWDRSPYYYLDCSYPKSKTTCMVVDTESSIIQQRLRSVENTDQGYKIITVEGVPFDVIEKVTLDDTISMQKTWKIFNETKTEITSDEQMYEWNQIFRDTNASIQLEAYYYYHTNYHDEYDGESYAESFTSSSNTFVYNPDFCDNLRNASIHYELLDVSTQQLYDSVNRD